MRPGDDFDFYWVHRGHLYRLGQVYTEQQDGSVIYPFDMQKMLGKSPWQQGQKYRINETFKLWQGPDNHFHIIYAADGAVRKSAEADFACPQMTFKK